MGGNNRQDLICNHVGSQSAEDFRKFLARSRLHLGKSLNVAQ